MHNRETGHLNKKKKKERKNNWELKYKEEMKKWTKCIRNRETGLKN